MSTKQKIVDCTFRTRGDTSKRAKPDVPCGFDRDTIKPEPIPEPAPESKPEPATKKK